MKKEEEQNSHRTKWGWWLLKLWFGMLCASVVGSWCVTWVIFLITPRSTGPREPFVVIYCQFIIIAFAIGAATLLLNCSRSIREDKVYRFLSFFLLPLLMVVAIGRPLCWSDICLLCPVYFAFFPCLTGAYILFLRKLKRLQ